MTLVAAFRVTGVPGLIGDFLITAGDDRRRGRKKIERIRPNVAVGWTGQLLQAEFALRRMYADLSGRPVQGELATWLEALDVAALGTPNLKLVGWIVDDSGPRSFHWDARTAPFVQWDEPAWFVGSGSDTAESLYDAYMRGSSTVVEADERDALDWILGTLTALNARDLVDSSTHELGFGGGYEALYWSASTEAFQYVERVLYYLAGQELDDAGSAVNTPVLADSVAHYRTIGECSLLAIIGPLPTGGQKIWAMSAVGVPVAQQRIRVHLEAQQQMPVDLRADFHAGLLAVNSPDGPFPPVPFIQCPWDPVKYIEGAVGGLSVRIPPELFEFAYRAHVPH